MLHPSQRCSPSRILELALTLDLSFAQSAQEPATNSDWLPLHIALQARADSQVVQSILEAYPAAAARVAAYGWLPMHIAARRNASARTIEAILDSYPQALSALSENGETPLVLARKHGNHGAADALQAAEAGGRIILVCFVSFHESKWQYCCLPLPHQYSPITVPK